MTVSGFADTHQALVFNDAAEPRGKTTVAAKLVQPLKRFPKRILYFVFGITSVTHHQSGSLEACVPVALREFSEGGSIPIPSGRNQFLLAKRAPFKNGVGVPFRWLRHAESNGICPSKQKFYVTSLLSMRLVLDLLRICCECPGWCGTRRTGRTLWYRV